MTSHWSTVAVRGVLALLVISLAAFVAWWLIKQLFVPLLVVLALLFVYRVAFLGFSARR